MPDDDKAHFPNNYDESYLYLLEVDPTHLHAFWEIIPDSIPDQILKESLNNQDLCLKIHCESRNHYRFCVDIHAQGLINNWFIELERPSVKCHAELGYNDPGNGKFISLCRSNDLYISLEQGFVNNPIKKKNQDKAGFHAYQEKQDDANPSPVNQKKGKGSHPMEHITEEDIKDYYLSLSKRRVSNPGFSPWRLILEKMYSAEALRTLRLSELTNLYIQDFSFPEAHSGYWSAVSSYSSIFKIDQDK